MQMDKKMTRSLFTAYDLGGYEGMTQFLLGVKAADDGRTPTARELETRVARAPRDSDLVEPSRKGRRYFRQGYRLRLQAIVRANGGSSWKGLATDWRR